MDTPAKKTILLVTTQSAAALTVMKRLKRFGYVPLLAGTAEHSVRLASDHSEISLILMDVKPGGDSSGIAAAARLVAIRRVPVVFLASRSELAAIGPADASSHGCVLRNSDAFHFNASIAAAFDLFAARENARRQDDRMRRLVARMDSLRNEERRAIATELHDGLGQDLSALKMNIAMLGSCTKDDAALTEKIKYLREMVDAAMRSARKISLAARPDLLLEAGLNAAVERQVHEFENKYGISCTCRIPRERIAASSEISLAMLAILEEALTNIARHAGASHVVVKLGPTENGLELAVFDNGRGIADDHEDATDAFGILGMKERARKFGGTVTVKRLPEKGTGVTARIPEGGR